MSDMADRLRRSYNYAESHTTHDHTVMLDAADHIERLERQAAESEQWMRDNMPEMYR